MRHWTSHNFQPPKEETLTVALNQGHSVATVFSMFPHRAYSPSGKDLCHVEECPYYWALPAPGVLVSTAEETFASISTEESANFAQFCVLDSQHLFSGYTCFWSMGGVCNCEKFASRIQQ